jgi:hypothetical protein
MTRLLEVGIAIIVAVSVIALTLGHYLGLSVDTTILNYPANDEQNPLIKKEQRRIRKMLNLKSILVALGISLIILLEILGECFKQEESHADHLSKEIQFTCNEDQLVITNRTNQRLKIEIKNLGATNYTSISKMVSLEPDNGRVYQKEYGYNGSLRMKGIVPDHASVVLSPKQEYSLEVKFPVKESCNILGWDIVDQDSSPTSVADACDAMIFKYTLYQEGNNEPLFETNLCCHLGTTIPSIELTK